MALWAGALLTLSACGGSGGRPPPGALLDNGSGGGTGTGNPNTPTPELVTVSGTITFQRIGVDASLGNGLNPNAPVTAAARSIVVEALNQSDRSVLDSTITNDSGAYTLTVPSNTTIVVSAKAQMLKVDTVPTWDVQILNNTNGDALYTLESSAFSTGNASSTGRNLLATTGFSAGIYTGARAAAPFAILDTIFKAQQLVVSADATTAFPPLHVYWSDQNRTTSMQFCVDSGDIGTSFYLSAGGSDDCSQADAGIYLVGAFDGGSGDTDEFDQHVIAHEFGHYIEDKFSRSDSIGGPHGLGDLLDLRLAFGEGWGNAVSAMTLNDPQYRDSFDGVDSDFGFSVESESNPAPGWYSELSAAQILWDLFDGISTAEPFDIVSAGFTPIYMAMTGQQRSTDALTSVFSFLDVYASANPGDGAGVAQLRSLQQIFGTGAFGSGEMNDGGDASVLPVYRPVALNDAPQIVCTNAANGDSNKLGFRKFFVLALSSDATVTVSAIGTVNPGDASSAAAADPDILVSRRGASVLRGEAAGPAESIDQQPLAAGTYVIELYDFAASGPTPTCMSFAVTGS